MADNNQSQGNGVQARVNRGDMAQLGGEIPGLVRTAPPEQFRDRPLVNDNLFYVLPPNLLDCLLREIPQVKFHPEMIELERAMTAVCSPYDNSEAIFRMVVLVNHLQLECGVRYNPDRIYDPDFTDSRHLFIHGLFTDHGGTCASMPVFYVAVGRRLGYPLRLVHAKAHVFLRWDDAEGLSGFPPERVNIEGAARGMNSHPDEFYHTWPMRIDPRELEAGQYLHSLTPREALASFLALRGNCLQDNARFDEAAHAYRHACLFAPHIERYAFWHDVNLALCGYPIPEGFDEVNAIVTAERERIAALQRT